MTHKQAIGELLKLAENGHTRHNLPSGMISQLNRWKALGFIPAIKIPLCARILGCKPSDIDDFFIGKDNWTVKEKAR